MVGKDAQMVRIPRELWKQLKQLGADDGLSGQQAVTRAITRGAAVPVRARQLATELYDFLSREGDSLKEALWFDETDSVEQAHACCETLLEQLDDMKDWDRARVDEEDDDNDNQEEEEDEDEVEEEA